MIRWLRQTRFFSTGAIAALYILASQIIATSAIASRMEAIHLVLDASEAQTLCLSDTGENEVGGPAHAIVHKSICDICLFATQAASAPCVETGAFSRFSFSGVEALRPLTSAPTSQRQEPRLTRGPPPNA